MFKTVKSFLKKLFSKKNALPLLAGIILLFLLCNMSYQGGLVEGFVEGNQNNASGNSCEDIKKCNNCWKKYKKWSSHEGLKKATGTEGWDWGKRIVDAMKIKAPCLGVCNPGRAAVSKCKKVELVSNARAKETN